MSGDLPAWVLRSFLRPPVPAESGADGFDVSGVLVLSAESPTTLRRDVLVDGAPVPTRWELPSPKVAADFPGTANARRARFRAGPVPAGAARVEVAVEDLATGTRVVTASLALPSEQRPVPADLAAIRRRVDTLIAGGEREPAEFDALRAGLKRVAETDQDPAWLEAAILVAGAFRMWPRVTFRRLGELRQLRQQEGRVADFDDFHTRFARLLAPYTLSMHGYRTSLESLRPDTVWSGVDTLVRQLAGLGYECFVNSGTLLGLVREGQLIGYDDDLDLAVILHASSPPDVAVEWITLRHRLADAGLLSAWFEATRHLHCKARLASGVAVDLFPAWRSGTGRVSVWPYSNGGLLAEDLLPLQRFDTGRVDVAVPRRPEKVLTSNYGPDWRTPDPTWRFDWPAAKRLFPDFCAAMAAAWEAREEAP